MQPTSYGVQPGYWKGIAGEADMQQAYYTIGQQQLAAMVVGRPTSCKLACECTVL